MRNSKHYEGHYPPATSAPEPVFQNVIVMEDYRKMEKFKQNPFVKKVGFNRIVLIIVLILMYVVFCLVVPGFAGKNHLLSTLNYVYFLGLLSLGVTFVIATGASCMI